MIVCYLTYIHVSTVCGVTGNYLPTYYIGSKTTLKLAARTRIVSVLMNHMPIRGLPPLDMHIQEIILRYFPSFSALCSDLVDDPPVFLTLALVVLSVGVHPPSSSHRQTITLAINWHTTRYPM